jgi:transcriptional regulator with XRE-family HTH domain
MTIVMPASSSSSAQAARQRLGEQLRELRSAARISGVDFASAVGWRSSAMVSMVEKGQRPITADHVRLWCRVCGADDRRLAELLTEQAAVARLWISFRDLGRRTGLAATQRMLSGDMWERVTLFRSYQTKLVHGLLQTPPYMTAIMRGVRAERGVEFDDVDEAVTDRMSRQRFLHQAGRRFVFVVEEPALWFRPGSSDVQRGMLVNLLEMMRLPSVSFGIIPMDADRRGHRPRESFDITDADLVTIELMSGFLSLTHPEEVAAYTTAWTHLFDLSVHGEKARSLVLRAVRALDESSEFG